MLLSSSKLTLKFLIFSDEYTLLKNILSSALIFSPLLGPMLAFTKVE